MDAIRHPRFKALVLSIAMLLLACCAQVFVVSGHSLAATHSMRSPSAKARMLARIRDNRGRLDIAQSSVKHLMHKRSADWTSLGQSIQGPISATLRSTGRSIFVRGSDNAVHHRYASSESNWGSWETVGGDITSAVGVDPTFDRENLDVVVRGTGGKVWHRAYGFGEPWEKIGDLNIQGTPVVRHYASTDAIIFARGDDNSVWMIDQVNFTWQSWVSLGGDITSDLDVAWGGDSAGIFGRGSDNQLMYYPLNAPNPSWVPMGQTLASAPSVSTPDNTKMDVAVRSSNNTLLYRPFVDGAWKPWIALGGATDDRPMISQMTVFSRHLVSFLVHGTDKHTRQLQYQPDTGEASSWIDEGGIATTYPTPVTFTLSGGETREVFVRGSDGAVWRAWV